MTIITALMSRLLPDGFHPQKLRMHLLDLSRIKSGFKAKSPLNAHKPIVPPILFLLH
ncbi:protein of unknown function [Shewanella benthica]|uniref:Uncharacterized protein n=1 Tax=Shewanella benthica TaxID=43661 RepID=A0A330M932_9GAMM|nr:protein of unknown function [Shewanella benthica]